MVIISGSDRYFSWYYLLSRALEFDHFTFKIAVVPNCPYDINSNKLSITGVRKLSYLSFYPLDMLNLESMELKTYFIMK